MKVGKKARVIASMLILGAFLLATQSAMAQQQWWVHPPHNGTKYVIGYTPRARLSPVWSILLAQANSTAKELGVQLKVLDIQSETDATGQMSVIEDFMTQNVDFIIAGPADEKAIITAIRRAAAKQIPIGLIISHAPTPGVPTAFWMSTDDYLGAVKLADEAALYMKYKGNFVLLQGVLGQYSCEARQKGIMDVFNTYPDIKVIAQQPGNWERVKGTQVMEDFITRYGDKIDAIVAFNDEMALGAAKAYEAANKKLPPIFSYNGHLEALTYTKKGTLTSTIDMNWAMVGDLMIRQAVGIMKGDKPLGVDITIPTNLVTQGNADFYINKLKSLGITQ
jgi:ABC-type sugar transport system substrate-binding protein